MRFKIVAVGRDSPNLISCLNSIASLQGSFDVAIVDDASQGTQQRLVRRYAEKHGWSFILNTYRRYATANQRTAWRMLLPQDEDVIVFMDLDDRFASRNVLRILESYYERGAWMTYGSYEPEPADHPSAQTCRPACPYPTRYVSRNTFRTAPHYFNHLRSISWRVLKHLTDEDLKNRKGEYWRAITDTAVMIPCLELAGERAVFVSEVLYKYSCSGVDAVWRTMPDLLRREGADLKMRPAKQRLDDDGSPLDIAFREHVSMPVGLKGYRQRIAF